jgi:hypothetical protein
MAAPTGAHSPPARSKRCNFPEDEFHVGATETISWLTESRGADCTCGIRAKWTSKTNTPTMHQFCDRGEFMHFGAVGFINTAALLAYAPGIRNELIPGVTEHPHARDRHQDRSFQRHDKQLSRPGAQGLLCRKGV